MSIGCACKFFGFSIPYAILNLPLSILLLQFELLNPCTISPFSPFPFPSDNPPKDLYIYDSVPILAYLFLFFFFDPVVESCEFVAFLMFMVLIFFFLNEPLYHFM